MEFTKEQLIRRAHLTVFRGARELENHPDRDGVAADIKIASIAARALMAEPIYQLWDQGYYDTEKEIYDAALKAGGRGRIVYTAPPAPVSVPDGVLKSLLPDAEKSEFWFEHDGKILFEGVKFNNAVFDACRDAMLHGAEPVSNRDELPLDYLQGHKDGLEWAAQLAEANHPHTGDWLYDDPIELAKAIRKGPDMPELKSVPADADDNFYSWFGRFWSENYQQNNYTTSAKQMLGTMAEFAFRAGRESATQVGNSPVIPDGWVMLPVEPTPDMREAYHQAQAEYEDSDGLWSPDHQWQAMLAAAPQQEVNSDQ